MFGHDDSDKSHDDNVNPQHDAVLDSAAQDSTTDSSTSPAYIATPAPNDEPVSAGAEVPETPAAPTPPAGGHDLIDIKQSALKQLTPLVGHLDQTPEEKFRTTMMMIQASDDQSLIKDAYEAAQQISDEKTKAQALLDIINEINYFTQHS